MDLLFQWSHLPPLNCLLELALLFFYRQKMCAYFLVNFRWKGSLYKLVWLDLVVYLIIYYLINLLYRFALNSAQKETFHMIVAYCDDISTQLPVSFVLGFFVSGVIGRWFQTFMFIPWLNEITYSVMAAVNCADTRVSRKIRLSVMRYLNLAWILAMRRISDRIAERFSQQHKPKGGNTKDDDDCICRGRNEIWSVSQCPDKKNSPSRRMQSAKTTPNISSSPLDGQANIKIFNFNENAAPFDGSDEWSIKETLFFVRATFGRIILENEAKAFERIAQQHFQKTHQRYIPEPWVPIEWAVRLIHKAGLHANIADPKIVAAVNKVALCVMNPFGDDYEDFECSEILDSNLDVSYRAVLLDEATFPESLKTATFMPKPMKGAESDHLMDFLENTTREIQETEFTCEMSE
ncbi:unnamed protein product [Schistocephalus solidus]|uniref:Bestrophin homolog n=1 Tax=Schistocephalus solidus TaxID=70667 RepID=A0A183SN39_SCHSO|nr:unnamed protein product [Schistocephalus solidus]